MIIVVRCRRLCSSVFYCYFFSLHRSNVCWGCFILCLTWYVQKKHLRKETKRTGSPNATLTLTHIQFITQKCVYVHISSQQRQSISKETKVWRKKIKTAQRQQYSKTICAIDKIDDICTAVWSQRKMRFECHKWAK